MSHNIFHSPCCDAINNIIYAYIVTLGVYFNHDFIHASRQPNIHRQKNWRKIVTMEYVGVNIVYI